MSAWHSASASVPACCARYQAMVRATAVASGQTSWEAEPMIALAAQGQLQAFEHSGFWQPMDTLREKNLLEELWQSGQAPWKTW